MSYMSGTDSEDFTLSLSELFLSSEHFTKPDCLATIHVQFLSSLFLLTENVT